MNFEDVTVLLPALNEEAAIQSTIHEVINFLPGCRILVVDNGSDDRTVEFARALGAEIFREPQRGKGFAVRRGFRELDLNCKIVLLVDADDTYDLSNAPSSIQMIREYGYGMIVGTRIVDKVTHTGRKETFKFGHTFGNWALSLISRILAPTGIKDSLSGWRVMSREFINSFNSTAAGFEIEAELNSHAHLLHCSIANTDVRYRGRSINSDSKLKTYSDGLKILNRNLALFRSNRPQLAFNVLALPWLAVSSWLNFRALQNFLETGLLEQFPSLIAGVGTFLVAGMFWMCGIILERIKLMRVEIAQSFYRGL